MPQISQIAATYASQIFWLLITFGILYFGIGKMMVPRVIATVDAREGQIAADLAAAVQAAKASESQVKSADAELAERLAHHDLAVGNAKAHAMLNLQTVAAEVAQELVTKVSGLTVGIDAAADAVRRTNAHG